MARNSTLRIGDNFVLHNSEMNPTIRTYDSKFILARNSSLTIGKNVGMSSISVYVSTEIVIGDFCVFGGQVAIFDTDFHSLCFLERRIDVGSRSAPINIGSDVFIGANTVILKGVKIGDRAIVGAGSVVSRSIPAGEIWGGNPIRFIRNV